MSSLLDAQFCQAKKYRISNVFHSSCVLHNLKFSVGIEGLSFAPLERPFVWHQL